MNERNIMRVSHRVAGSRLFRSNGVAFKVLNLVVAVAFAALLNFVGTGLLQALPNQEIRTYYVTDAVGSPVIATDANANVTWSEDYLPYGERRYQQARAGNNDRWFTGAAQNVDSGLVSLGNRYYDPTLSRFLSIDPAGASGEKPFSVNRYAYANNNPYRYTDPRGTEAATASWLEQTNRFTDALPITKTSAAVSIAVIGGALLGPIALEAGVAAIANPATANQIALGTMELTAGDALGPGGLAVAAGGVAAVRGAVRAIEAPIEATRAGERFVRVGAKPENLKMSFSGLGGTQVGVHAFPEATFNQLGRDPAALKNFGDLPGAPPQYFRILEPPAGTPI